MSNQELDERIFNLLNDYRQQRETATTGIRRTRKLIQEVLEAVKPTPWEPPLGSRGSTWNGCIVTMEKQAKELGL